LMAAGGDLGASVGPQLVGVVTDLTATSTWASELALSLALSPEQLGMKLGILVGMLFPLVGCAIAFVILRGRRKKVL